MSGPTVKDLSKLVLPHNLPLTPPMTDHIDNLRKLMSDVSVVAAFNEAIANMSPFVQYGIPNPWIQCSPDDFISYFESWFTYLAGPSGGLGYIAPFTWFYYDNPSGYYFVNTFQSKASEGATEYTNEIFLWTKEFVVIRGEFMDSKESRIGLKEWLADPIVSIDDFNQPEDGFQSFNEFFTRTLKTSATGETARPIAEPSDETVVTASADSIINFIISDLTLSTQLNVKSRQLNVNQLLDGSPYADNFVGGTAVSCVLMPQNYHHYHCPVDGRIVESAEVPGIYNGVMDGEHWMNPNVGMSTTDFSFCEDFHRAYFIIQTQKYGYVAVIPVGLNTISAIFPSVINDESSYVPRDSPEEDFVYVKKGDELGHFAYGGSLNILLFEKSKFVSLSVLMGARLGLFTDPDEDDAFVIPEDPKMIAVPRKAGRRGGRGKRGKIGKC